MGRLLLIEDNDEVREAMTFLLERAGHTVVVLPDGRKAVDVCQKRDVDIVITDIVMPEREGIDTIRVLRKQIPGIGIVAISGGGRYGRSEEYLTAARQLGADVTLSKPVDPATLLEVLSDLLVSEEGD